MKNILFINACVRSNSRTEKLAQEYLETLTKAGQYTVTERDVTKLNLLPMTEARLIKRDRAIETCDYTGEDFDYAKEFADADRIVIAAPYWDCSFPSFLKLYFEHIMIRNITIGYSPKGRMLKLCQADKLVYITTSGGYIHENSSVKLQIEELCAVFRINDVRFYCAEALDVFPDKVETILNEKLQEILSEE